MAIELSQLFRVRGFEHILDLLSENFCIVIQAFSEEQLTRGDLQKFADLINSVARGPLDPPCLDSSDVVCLLADAINLAVSIVMLYRH